MRAAMRFTALAVAMLAAAACGDVLATPAAAPAPVVLSVQPGGELSRSELSALYEQVDGLYVQVTRGEAVVMEETFDISPAAGEIRRTLRVVLEREEEDLCLTVELRRQGVAVFAGTRVVRLSRGKPTIAEIFVFPLG